LKALCVQESLLTAFKTPLFGLNGTLAFNVNPERIGPFRYLLFGTASNDNFEFDVRH
jgi:hypothetical protein